MGYVEGHMKKEIKLDPFLKEKKKDHVLGNLKLEWKKYFFLEILNMVASYRRKSNISILFKMYLTVKQAFVGWPKGLTRYRLNSMENIF